MTNYSQTDPRWANTKLGNTPLTLGHVGCATTAFCNGVNAITGSNWTPDQLAHNANLYNADSLLDWDKACAFVGHIKFQGAQAIEDDKRIDIALKDPNQFVIWNVNSGHHFVLGWNKTLFGRYQCQDSWDGRVKDVKKFYHDITGSRFFTKI